MSQIARKALLVMAVATLATVAGFFAGRLREPPPPVAPEIAIASEAPARLLALALPDTQGRTQALSQWQGTVMVVNFWATWCAPCKEEMPEFSLISNEFSANGVQFVGISIDSADAVRTFQKQTDVSYPLLISDAATLALSGDLGNRAQALPFTVVLRADGTLQQVKLGIFRSAELRKAIRSALAAR